MNPAIDMEFTPGEIQRSLARLESGLLALTNEVRGRTHELSNIVNLQLAETSVLKEKVHNLEIDCLKLDVNVQSVTSKAAWISGATAAIMFVIGLISKLWK